MHFCNTFKTIPSIFLIVFYSSALYSDEHDFIKINTVDTNNKPFNVQTVRWWYKGNNNTKQQLKCNKKKCNEWLLKKEHVKVEHTKSITISADASVATPDDTSCWRLYHGELSLTTPLKDSKLVMHDSNIACK